MKYLILATAALALVSTSANAQSRRMSSADRMNAEMVESSDAFYAQAQYRIDMARSFCERNGGTFYMANVRIDDRSRTRTTVRTRDRGAVYQNGRTTVISVNRLIFGAPKPEVDVRGDRYDGVDTSRACVYPEPPPRNRR